MLKGSLYYYIKSKEELLYRLATEVHDDVDALLARRPRAKDYRAGTASKPCAPTG